MSNEKLSPSLDPATYLGMSAGLASGMGDPALLAAHADVLLSHCQAGDYSVMIRHHNSLVIAGQMAAHAALHKALQCETPEDYDKWMASAKKAQALADAATLQVMQLTNTEAKLLPYRQRVQSEATQTARLTLSHQNIRAEALRLVTAQLNTLNAEALKETIIADRDWPNQLTVDVE